MKGSPEPKKITPGHYQVICGLALMAIFLAQMQQNVPLLMNTFVLFLGAISILYRIHINPLFIYLALAGGHMIDQYNRIQISNAEVHTFHYLEMPDVLLCMATVTYLMGLYRLHGMWFQIHPEERAIRQMGSMQNKEIGTRPPLTRSEDTLTPEEILWLLLPIPLFALAAELCAFLLWQPWALAGLPQRWRQFLAIAWALLLVLFAASQFFRYGRRLSMKRATAQLLLQDLLWQETRGEQRRLNRWIVWQKLKLQEETNRNEEVAHDTFLVP